MINRLRKQEQIGKATFQFTSHSTTTCKQRNNPNSKLKPTTLTFCSCKSFASHRTRFFLVHGAQLSPSNCQNKQSINHRNIHHSPNQDMHVFGASANAGPHYQKLYARVTHIWGNCKGQPDPSAMKGPRLEWTVSLNTVPPASGKLFYT